MSDITPVPSRRTVNSTMTGRGLRSAAELAVGKPCGTRVRYYAGCRCPACRTANSQYEAERADARRRGERNGLVSAEPARLHLAWLSAHGIGRKTAADAAKVPASTVSKVLDSQRTRLREQTLKRILSVTRDAASDGARIDGKETWRLLDELMLVWGYSAKRVASEVLGRPTKLLQLSRNKVTVRNAARVAAVHERLRLASKDETARALALVQELYEEGYRQRLPRELAALAAARGWPPLTLEPHKPHRLHKGGGAGLLRNQVVVAIEALHTSLVMGEEVAA